MNGNGTARTVLVTGFEPFGGEQVNPSWQAVQELSRRQTPDGVRLVTAQIPCVYGVAIDVLRAAVAEHEPDLVVAVGQAGGRHAVTPERVAINVDDARIPDNAGNQPVDVPVVPDGPVGYFTGLPVKACVTALREAGIPAEVSQTAGTFVCNHLFYGLMHLVATTRPAMRAGFVHVPYSNEQVAAAASTQPSLSIAAMADAIESIVQTCLRTANDLAVPAGAIS